MPASDETRYSIKKLHRVFALSSIALLAATVWMLLQDHDRQWKPIQRKAREIDRRVGEWRLLELESADSDDRQTDRIRQLKASMEENRSTWFDPEWGFPIPGRRLLELPILDAFNSPLQIENRWSEGLTQDFHFAQVNRFDRCTTCHTSIDQVASGTTNQPAYPAAETIELVLQLPASGDANAQRDDRPAVDAWSGVLLAVDELGIQIAESGLLRETDATVMVVHPASPAARAQPPKRRTAPRTVQEIRQWLMGPSDPWAASPTSIGLRLGDVVVAVNGQKIKGRADALSTLARAVWQAGEVARDTDASDKDEANDSSQIAVTIRRGLPHPYAGHPRLDLFVGDLSPHRISEFACSICHGGEGSATEFKWASHTPASESQRGRWRSEYDWFKNSHWAYPMLPKRFLESSCLRCHHQVADLLPSERFPEPPAPKLIRGFRLIRYWGCYGCHEINGYQAGAAVGPDLRLETDGPDASAQTQRPGRLRKPGPSLRYVGHRVDADFLGDWLKDPIRLRPSTRMPRVFGLWEHLDPDQREQTELWEQAEIQGVVTYLQAQTEEMPEPDKPQGIASGDDAEQLERGRILVMTRGCLACHTHQAFPDTAAYREPDALLLGLDLSDLDQKIRTASGRQWLYGLLRDPSRYSPRTRMPDLMLDPIEIHDPEGKRLAVTDPIDDILAFLLQPSGSAMPPEPLPKADPSIVEELAIEYLKKDFHEDRAREFVTLGIPASMAGAVGAAEQELLVSADADSPHSSITLDQKLRYVGRRAIGKYGCFGCHDIAGFENAQQIGVALSDWGRKDAEQLAFEQIAGYVDGQDDFYRRHLLEGDRIGFLHQKLQEPRSFDYRVVQDKGVHDRLRMPQFPLSVEDREAIMTFVLGLVAQPPSERYVYRPDSRQRALIEGQQILDTYRCDSCHMLRPQQWQLAFQPDSFRQQKSKPRFPVATHVVDEDRIERSLEEDALGRRHATLTGIPTLDDDAHPTVFDDYGDELFDDEQYDSTVLEYAFQLWEPAVLDGQGYQVGESPLFVTGPMVQQRHSAQGGFLAKYLLPKVVELEHQVNPNAKGSEAWSWLPPPLMGEGAKVQPDWLHNYILDPYRVRPASLMRMPRFDLSEREARRLADYFAARDNAEYPYEFLVERSDGYVHATEQQYRQSTRGDAVPEAAEDRAHFDDAMRIVTNKNYCVTCHRIADFDPQTSDRAMGPDLADCYRRFRPDYLRRWIAKPAAVLPYAAMPAIIPYESGEAHLGGVDQSLYAGSSIQQLEALVDLLVNFDRYVRQRSRIGPLVEAAAEEAVQPVP